MESKDINIDDILNYPVDQRELDREAYNATFQGDPTTDSATTVTPLFGPWNGFMYRKIVPTFPSRGMISMTLCPSSSEDQHFEGSSRSNLGDFTVSGKCSPGNTETTINISMKREFIEHHPTQYWEGQMDVNTETIMGTWGSHPDPTTHHGTFILKRTSPEDLCFRPAPVTFEIDKVHSLWKFALTAIAARVRRQTWSWSYFKERMDNRKRFIELYIRNGHFGCPLNSDELWEFRRVRQTLTSADSRYYHSLANYRVRRTINHGYVAPFLSLRFLTCSTSAFIATIATVQLVGHGLSVSNVRRRGIGTLSTYAKRLIVLYHLPNAPTCASHTYRLMTLSR
jgi:hypothetical protein